MLSTVNLWMSLAGLTCLVAGVFLLRRDLAAARPWDKLILLAPVFFAAALAAFAPEHFSGPEFVQSMVPPWMPGHWFWPRFVGCALLAAAASLTAQRVQRLSSTMLGIMFLLFVGMIYLPSVIRHPHVRIAWTICLRDLSFAAGSWALASVYSRNASPQASRWMVLFARLVLAVAATFYGVQHFLHPEFAPGVPLELLTPPWVPFPLAWSYLSGAILLAAGIALAVNRRPRLAAATIGALMTFLTVFLYGVILAMDRDAPAVNEGINYVADTLLYAGTALALALALPGGPPQPT